MSVVASEQHSWPAGAEPDLPWEIQVRRDGSDTPLISRRMTQDFAVIGRRADCDVRLPGTSVAPRHIYLQRLPEAMLAVDLGSPDFGRRTGVLGRPGRTFVDVVRPGESIRVGDYQVAVIFSITDRAPVVDDIPADGPPLPQFPEPVACWELTNIKGDEAVIRRHVRHAVTLIGSGPLCRIRIAHASASSVHAGLVWAGRELVVVDLCSRTGVRVNDKPVRRERLKQGDELSIGHCRGVIRYLPTSSRSGSTIEAEWTEAVQVPPELSSNAVGLEDSARPTVFSSSTDDPPCPVPSEQSPAPFETISGTAMKPQYSEEFVLSLLAQFTAMQQQLLDQTHRLMSDVTTRLSVPPGIASQPPDGISASTESHSENCAPSSANSVEENEADPSVAAQQIGSAKADVHAWLNQRLAGLESAPPGRLAQLWERLMGSG